MPANPTSRRRAPNGEVTYLRTRDSAVLVAARKAKGLTQRMVAGELSVSPGMLAMIETGQRHPSYELGQRLADLYGVSIRGLFDEVPYSEATP